MTDNIIVREDSGKMLEQANYVGGKWVVFWTSVASNALQLTDRKAEEIVQALGESGIEANSLPASEQF